MLNSQVTYQRRESLLNFIQIFLRFFVKKQNFDTEGSL